MQHAGRWQTNAGHGARPSALLLSSQRHLEDGSSWVERTPRDQCWRDPPHLAGQPQALQPPDEIARAIDLPPPEPMKGRAGEGMVIVMPTLSEAEQPHDPFIVAAIPGLKGPPAEGVADRIDAPGDVMGQEDPHQSAP